MKKIFALLLSAAATIVSAYAQDKPQKGDIIYGTVTDSIGPVAGAIVIERNANERIMAQTKTDLNGNFSFRLVNPDDELYVMENNQKWNNVHITLPITKRQYDIDWDTVVDKQLKGLIVGLDIVFGPDPEPEHYYIPFRDFIHYYSIEDLFNNMFLYF